VSANSSLCLCIASLFSPLNEIGNLINLYSETLVSLQNFKTLMEMKPELPPHDAIPVGSIDSIDFNNVSYHYNSTPKNALNNITFNVMQGEKIAFASLRCRKKYTYQTFAWII
jgi:ATP-binding cassette subfamily B protein